LPNCEPTPAGRLQKFTAAIAQRLAVLASRQRVMLFDMSDGI
jgi:hypothetical protein